MSSRSLPRRADSSAQPARRLVLGAGATGLAALLAACTTGSSTDSGSGTSGTSGATSDGGAAGADAVFPRTVVHALGETEIPARPVRVATISWVNPDAVLALGVVPVGMDAVTWGGNDNQSTDWIDAKITELGGEQPAKFVSTDGIATDQIAAVTPDLIVAAYSGLDQEQYDALSQIAPTIAYPTGGGPWTTSWQDSLAIIGEALGLEDEAVAVIEDVEGQIAGVGADFPELAGTTFLFGTIDPSAAEQISLYTDADNRPKFLTELGMEQAPVVVENQPATGEFYMSWSAERADELVSDIMVAWFNDAAAVDAVLADPLLSRIPAIAAGNFVAQSDQAQALSISAASPLSLPWALENVVPQIAEAAARAKSQ